MSSHVLLPALDATRPATLSPTVLSMLREELGFDGLLVSDAVDMQGVARGAANQPLQCSPLPPAATSSVSAPTRTRSCTSR